MRLRLTGLLLPLAALAAALGAGLAHADSVPRMDAEALGAILGSPDLAVVDVRTGPDWEASPTKIKGAVRQDPHNVQAWAAGYPKTLRIVLYCA